MCTHEAIFRYMLRVVKKYGYMLFSSQHNMLLFLVLGFFKEYKMI